MKAFLEGGPMTEQVFQVLLALCERGLFPEDIIPLLCQVGRMRGY
jgi:hypothetical protein